MKKEYKIIELKPPFMGYIAVSKAQITVPVIKIDPAYEGRGYFGKLLKRLEGTGKTIIFPTVVSEKLAMILLKKGYENAVIYDNEMKQNIEVMRR